jgi:hypothetical protein
MAYCFIFFYLYITDRSDEVLPRLETNTAPYRKGSEMIDTRTIEDIVT